MSWFDSLSSRWRLLAVVTATIVLAVALPGRFVLTSPLPDGTASRRAPSDATTSETARSSDPPVTARPIAPAQGLPIGRWEVQGGVQLGGQQIAVIEFGGDGRFTGRSRAGQTTIAGTWGGETGALKATGGSSAQPGARFVCELVYVESTQAPQSSYVLGDCRDERDRWKLELYRAKAR